MISFALFFARIRNSMKEILYLISKIFCIIQGQFEKFTFILHEINTTLKSTKI